MSTGHGNSFEVLAEDAAMTPPERPEVAALAVASTREINTHSQMCPVWTQRMADARKPWQDVIVKCDCWVIPEAERSIRVMRERGIAVWATAAEPLRGALEHALHEVGGEFCDPFDEDHPEGMHNSQAAALRAALEATAPSTPEPALDVRRLTRAIEAAGVDGPFIAGSAPKLAEAIVKADLLLTGEPRAAAPQEGTDG